MFQSSKTIKIIFYINIVMFILSMIFPFIITYLAMYDINNSDQFLPFQLITYQFLHGGFLHILFNMFVLLSFGPLIEDIYGSKRMWIYYLSCGIASALLHSFMTNSGNTPLVGASGSIWGIMIMFTLLYPNEKLFLFFIPIGFKAKYIITIMFLLEVVGAFSVNDGVSHFGHIGGGLAGLSIFLLYKFKLLK